MGLGIQIVDFEPGTTPLTEDQQEILSARFDLSFSGDDIFSESGSVSWDFVDDFISVAPHLPTGMVITLIDENHTYYRLAVGDDGQGVVDAGVTDTIFWTRVNPVSMPDSPLPS